MPLMFTREEAFRVPPCTLWEGSSQEKFNEITAALGEAGIPFLTEPRAGADQMGKVVAVGLLRVLFWRFGAFRKTAERQKGWRIKVLESDFSRSSKAALEPSGNSVLGPN
jgi:hypothetical protein